MADTAAAAIEQKINAQQIAQYQRDGAILIRNALTAQDLELLTRGLEESAANPGNRFTDVRGSDGRGETMVNLLPSMDAPSLRELMRTGTIAGLAGTVMGVASAQLVFDQIFIKAGACTADTVASGHAVLRVRGDDMVRVWLSADPSPRDLTVQVVRGSHRWNVVYGVMPGGKSTTKIAAEGRDFTYEGMHDAAAPPVPDIAAMRDSFDILSWDVEPGDALLFNANILHGAEGREYHPSTRRAFASVWGGPDLRCHCPPGNAVPSYAETAGFTIPHGARIGEHEDAYPVGWRRAATAAMA